MKWLGLLRGSFPKTCEFRPLPFRRILMLCRLSRDHCFRSKIKSLLIRLSIQKKIDIVTWTGDELELNENLESLSSKSDVEYRPKFFMNESFSCCWLICCDALRTNDNFVASDKSKGFIDVENMQCFSRESSCISLRLKENIVRKGFEEYSMNMQIMQAEANKHKI